VEIEDLGGPKGRFHVARYEARPTSDVLVEPVRGWRWAFDLIET
jgi:hypothetical protein